MYAQGILYFSLLNLVGLPSLSHTHTVFQAGCCKGCSCLAKVTLPAKLGGWMRSRAPWGSCPGPLGGSQAASPPRHNLCLWCLAKEACISREGKSCPELQRNEMR